MKDWLDNLPENVRRLIFASFAVILISAGWFFLLKPNNGSNNTPGEGQTPTPVATQQTTTPSATTPTSASASPTLTSPTAGIPPDNSDAAIQNSLPVPWDQLKKISSDAVTIATVADNPNTSYTEKSEKLGNLANKTILDNVNSGETTKADPAGPVTFKRFRTISVNSIIVELSIADTTRYMAFIPSGSGWVANAYGGEIGAG